MTVTERVALTIERLGALAEWDSARALLRDEPTLLDDVTLDEVEELRWQGIASARLARFAVTCPVSMRLAGNIVARALAAESGG